MTNFIRLAKALKLRSQRAGRFISEGKAKEMVAELILSGFDTLAQARAELEGRELLDVVGYTPQGEVVYASDLAWAIDFAENVLEVAS